MSIIVAILKLLGAVLIGAGVLVLIALAFAFCLITPAAMVTLILWLTGVI